MALFSIGLVPPSCLVCLDEVDQVMSHRTFVVLAAPLVVAAAWYAGTLATTPANGGSKVTAGLEVEGGPVAEVDHASRTTPVEHTFRVANRSTTPVPIERIETGCACTVADATTDPVQPGEVRDFRVRVTALPMNDLIGSQSVRVVLGGGFDPLVLQLRVRLPPAEQVLARPTTVSLTPEDTIVGSTRTVLVCVPNRCARPLSAADIRRVGCADAVEVGVDEAEPSPMFREYRLTITVKNGRGLVPTGACLRISTECGDVTVAIQSAAL